MKISLPILASSLVATASISLAAAQDQPQPNSNCTFEIRNLIITQYSGNPRSNRFNHMRFNFFDMVNGNNTHCDTQWNAKDDAPSDTIACEDVGFGFAISNFVDLKDFDMLLQHGWNEGSAEITSQKPKWARTRTTSGGTVSAVADETVVIEVHEISQDQDDGTTV